MKPFYTVEDLIGDDEIWFMATSSTMYRNNIKEYPTWFRESSSGDIPRLILKAKLGKIGYIPDMMSVYRKNRGGASFADNYFDETFLRNRIQMYRDINRELDYKYDRVLRRNIARYYRMMLDSKQYKNRYFRRAFYAMKYLHLRRGGWSDVKTVMRDYVLPEPLTKLYSTIRLLPHR